MFCGKCGKEISDDVKFCPHCGKSTSNEAIKPVSENKKVEFKVSKKELPKNKFVWYLSFVLFLFVYTCVNNMDNHKNSTSTPKVSYSTKVDTSKKEDVKKVEEEVTIKENVPASEDNQIGAFIIKEEYENIKEYIGCKTKKELSKITDAYKGNIDRSNIPSLLNSKRCMYIDNKEENYYKIQLLEKNKENTRINKVRLVHYAIDDVDLYVDIYLSLKDIELKSKYEVFSEKMKIKEESENKNKIVYNDTAFYICTTMKNWNALFFYSSGTPEFKRLFSSGKCIKIRSKTKLKKLFYFDGAWQYEVLDGPHKGEKYFGTNIEDK
ncbi:MAG: zinc-ribbon domain-containing protein [Alphaproteobacteria bacterium]